MTEEEWSSCNDPLVMLAYLRQNGMVNDRLLRLFAVACTRRIWEMIDGKARAAVLVAERFANGLAGPEELRAARLACTAAGNNSSWYAAASDAFIAARNAALSAQSGHLDESERVAQANLVRSMFDHPFSRREHFVEPPAEETFER